MGSLGTVLDRLSGLLTKYFLIGSYFPVLISLAASWGMWWSISPTPGRLAAGEAWQKGLMGAAVLAGAGVLAYLLSTLNATLRESLERPPLPGKLSDELTASEGARREKKNEELRQLQMDWRELRRRQDGWRQRLGEAREKGITHPKNATGAFSTLAKVEALREARRRGQLMKPADIEEAVSELCAAFESWPAEIRNQQREVQLTDNGKRLDAAAARLDELIDATIRHTDLAAVKALNVLQLNFATDELAPTRMGNIALSVQSYFLSRYEMNFNFFWTRVQKLMNEDKFFPVLQEAKAQLDFHVSMFWLSCLFSVFWTVTLTLFGYSPFLFLVAAVMVPLFVVRAFYELGVQSYRSYADLLRTTVDLYHFALLDSLHVALPPCLDDERRIWKGMHEWLLIGDYRDVRYRHPGR